MKNILITVPKLKTRPGVVLPVLAVLAAGTCVLQAQSIVVPNHSFESPDVTDTGGVSTVIESWQKAAPPVPDFTAGIFANGPGPRQIENADGSQVAYMFAVPGVSLSQELAAVYEVGKSYELSVGLRGSEPLLPGSLFEVNLYYIENAIPVTVASAVVSATADYATTTLLFDIDLGLPTVQASDDWAGQNIGIQLLAASTGGAGIVYWEADNVRLTAVPEPEHYALAGLGLLGFALYWRRHGRR